MNSIHTNTFLRKSHFKHLFHISDIHIRNEESYQENYHTQFKKTFKQIRHHPHYHPETALIVVTGDIFHSSLKVSAIAIELLRILTEGLTQIGPTIIIPGNHDEKKDVGEYDTSSLSALFSYNVGETKNLFYLKDTGIYLFGTNLVFGHTSVINKQLVRAQDIPYPDKIKIALFHGMIDNQDKNNFMLKGCDFAYTDFNGYDKVLLGDVHKFQNVAGQTNIYYSGSLIQQNYGEDRRLHGGLLVWTLQSKDPPQFVDILNEYQYITLEIFRGTIRGETASNTGPFHIRTTIPFDPNSLPTNSNIKFKCTETTPIQITELIEKLKQKTNIIDYKTEYLKPNNDNDSSIQQQTQDKPNLNTYLNQYHPEDKEKLLQLDKTYTQKQITTTNHKQTRWEPIELKWENMFNYIGSHQLDFNTIPNGLTSICGPNASGKSKFIEIFTLAIFGIKPNLVPHIVSKGLKKANTSIKIKLYQDIWEIKWSFTILKSGKGETKVKLLKNQVNVNSTDKKANENTIKELFGELDDLCNTHISKQGRHETFIYLTPNEQGNVLTRLFQTNVYEETHKQVKRDITEKTKLKKKIETDIQKQPSTIDKKEQLETEKNLLHNRKISTETIIEETQDKIRTNDILLEKRQGLETNIHSLQQTIIKNTNLLTPNTTPIETEREDILIQIEKNTQNIHPNLSSLDNIDAMNHRLSRTIKQLETDTSDLETDTLEIQRLTNLKPTLQIEISNTQSKKDTLLSLIPFQKQWSRSGKEPFETYLDSKLKNNPSILETKYQELDIENNYQSFIENETQIEELKEKEIEIRNEIKELETLLTTDPFTYNDQCPSCLNNKKVNHIPVKQKTLETLHTKLSTIQHKHQELINWNETHKEIPNLYQEYHTAREVQMVQNEYEEYLVFLENKNQLQTYSQFLLDNRERFDKIEKDLSCLYTKRNRLQENIHTNTLTKKDLETKLETYEKQRSQMENNHRLEKHIRELKKTLLLFDQHQNNIQLQKQIQLDTNTLQGLRENLNTLDILDPKSLKTQLKHQRNELQDMIKQETALEYKLLELQTIQKKLEEWKTQYQTMIEELELLKTYEKITSDYPNYCNSKYLEQFQNNINFYLLNMTKDFTITIHYEKKKDNKHDIQFLKNDSIPIEHCSGFEKFVISISIRIALSILSPTHSMNLMMIDEGFGVFDHRHNKQLLKMLEPLQSIFKHIFVITHLDELQYEIPHKIRIRDGTIC
jgi:DNA repair exonuclease SbcCD ATPase subunit/DNA repair exonuclease SbcCD nuclease subunit